MQLCGQATGGALCGRLRRAQAYSKRSERVRANAGTRCVLALAVFLAPATCSPPSADVGAPDVTVASRITPSPPSQGPARIELSLADSAGRPMAARAVELEANMNHAGMVPVRAEARPDGIGGYCADIEFTMGGDWYLLIDATLEDGRTLQRRVDVPGVRSP